MAQSASECSEAGRLALCERSALGGAVDGVWWPFSTQLRTGLPDLIAVLGLQIGPVRRVVYDPSVWQPAPSRIIRGNTVIAVDPYALVARDTIYLVGTHSRNALLFVVPPTTANTAVRRLLGVVSEATQPINVDMLRQLVGQFARVGEDQ